MQIMICAICFSLAVLLLLIVNENTFYSYQTFKICEIVTAINTCLFYRAKFCMGFLKCVLPWFFIIHHIGRCLMHMETPLKKGRIKNANRRRRWKKF